MGSSQANTQNRTQFNIEEWSKQPQLLGDDVLYCPMRPHIQQHKLVLHNNRDLQFLEKMIEMRKSDDFLVRVEGYVISQQSQPELRRGLSGFLYTERILYRLPEISPVQLPDFLHILSQVIKACQNLTKYFGYFKINPYSIGIGNTAKMWHSANYAELYPAQIARSQYEMALSILEAVQPFVDFTTMPRQEPSFKYFVLKRSNKLGFEVLKTSLQQFAKYFCEGGVPSRTSRKLNAKSNRQFQLNLPTSDKIAQPSRFNLMQTSNFRNEYPNNTNIFPAPQNTRKPIVFSRQPINYEPNRFQQQQTATVRSSRALNIINPQPNLVYGGGSTNIHQSGINISHQLPRSRVYFNNNQPPITQNTTYHPHRQSQPVIFETPQLIRPNSAYNNLKPSLSRSNVSEQSSSKRSISAHSERLRDKPLSSVNSSHTNSHQSLNFNNYPHNIKQRSHSDLKNPSKNPLFVSFMPNLSMPVHNNVNGAGLLKPISIKQSIQGVEYRNKVNLKNPPASMIVPTINYDNRVHQPSNHLSINSSVNSSLDFKIPATVSITQSPRFPDPEPQPQPEPEQKPAKNPWQTIMNVIKSKPNPETEQAQYIELLSPRPQIGLDNDPQTQTEKINSMQLPVQKVKSKVTFVENNPPKQSINEIESPGPGVKNLYDAKQSESINNSSRNFYNNLEMQQYSQLAESSHPWEFTLHKKNQRSEGYKQDKQESDAPDFSKIKINDDFTPLDFMKKLRITQTIRKGEYQEDQKLQTPSESDDDDKIIKQRSRSRQFNKEIEKLGFNMNYEDNSSPSTPSDYNKQTNTQKDVVMEWTPSFFEKHENQSKFVNTDFNKKSEQPTYGERHNSKTKELSFETKYPQTYEQASYGRQPQEYKFQWDPELLADIESKDYANSVVE